MNDEEEIKEYQPGRVEGKRDGPSSRQKPSGRRKKNKKLTTTGCLIWLLVVIGIGVLMAAVFIKGANDILAFVKPASSVTIEVERGASVKEVAQTLKENGVIDIPILFRIYSRQKGYDNKINPGVFDLNTDMSYEEIFGNLRKQQARESVRFTIPEGYELRQIADLLVNKKLIDREKFFEAVENYDFDYWFLEDLPKSSTRLEGYLFPDTYDAFADEGEVSIIKRMLDNFKAKYSKEFAQRQETLGMTPHEVITLASIIEREASAASEFPKVSSVFHNRLNSTQYPLLQSCATIQYVLKERREVLTIEDTKIDSPYNTYVYKGLPPGPIASPGLRAIDAALNPETTDFYFFVATADKTHIFSKTFEQHQQAIRTANSSKGTGAVTQ